MTANLCPDDSPLRFARPCVSTSTYDSGYAFGQSHPLLALVSLAIVAIVLIAGTVALRRHLRRSAA